MVGAGEPEDFLTFLACAAGEDVLEGIVEDVAEVEDAGDVWRWDDDGIWGFLRSWIGFEAFSIEPGGVPLGFDRLGFIGFRQLGHGGGGMAEGGGFVQHGRREVVCVGFHPMVRRGVEMQPKDRWRNGRSP